MTTQRWHIPMDGRDPEEPHRTATPLELLFDLCFVVAVAQAATVLHHELADGHIVEGLIGYAAVFFAIWWAWMNFTWFASAYDTDDVLYRLLTFVQMAGVLVIAAGVAQASEQGDFLVVTIGYAIMRLGLIGQWVRASIEHPGRRDTARRYAAGIGVLQIGWIGRLLLPPEAAAFAFPMLVAAELAVPMWAERNRRSTPWHREHIAERYGLFTIIVLGEVVLAATTAIQEAVGEQGLSLELVVLAVGALVLIASLWWAYFKHNAAEEPELRGATPFAWGYGHYVIFAAVAAVGAGIQVVADLTHQEAALPPIGAALGVAIPVAVYLAAVWLVISAGRGTRILWPLVAGLVGVIVAAVALGTVNVPLAVLVIGLVVAGTVGVTAYRRQRWSAVSSPSR